jgi:transcriptional regulator with XRE-family HTH domain
MKKTKLIEARKSRGYSQEYVASKLGMDVSNYCRRENGENQMSMNDWKKASELLEYSIADIFEPDENQVFIHNENSSNNNQGNNNTVYSPVPEFILDALQKLIKNLEEENKYLKELLKQGKK